jgi:hypothetical protein
MIYQINEKKSKYYKNYFIVPSGFISEYDIVKGHVEGFLFAFNIDNTKLNKILYYQYDRKFLTKLPISKYDGWGIYYLPRFIQNCVKDQNLSDWAIANEESKLHILNEMLENVDTDIFSRIDLAKKHLTNWEKHLETIPVPNILYETMLKNIDYLEHYLIPKLESDSLDFIDENFEDDDEQFI